MTAQELKNSILQLAIQGKLVKQDSSDEPASVLLEKIKEEREKLIKEKKIKREKYSEIYKDHSDNHYYEKFEDGTINDITEEIPFEIPKSWCWLRINNCSDVYTGNSISESVKKSKYTGLSEGFNYIGTKDVNFDNTINYGNGIKIPFEECKFRKAYKNNTLICIEGGSAGRKVAILSEDVCFGNKLATINSWIINFEYIYLIFQSSIVQNFFKNNMTGIIGGVSIKKLKTFLIPIPPIKEQERIVNSYKKYTPLINDYDIKYCKIKQLNNSYKEELKKSILQYAIQGKLVKQDPNDESAEVLINKILDEKRKLIKTKQIKKENLSVIYKDNSDNQFYEKFDDGRIVNITDEIPFDIPNNWAWTRMKNICLINPKNSLDDNLETSFIPMALIDAGYSNFHNYEIKKWKEIKSGFTHFRENDIGLAKITPCFQNRKSTIFSNLKNGFGAGTTELYILRPINDLIYTKFIFWLIKSPYFIDNGVKTYSGTAGQQRINKDFIHNFLVPIPNYKTQVCIINKIENIFNLI